MSENSTEWRPIDTAPQDGTRILAYREGYAEDRAVVWWSRHAREWICVHGDIFPNATE